MSNRYLCGSKRRKLKKLKDKLHNESFGICAYCNKSISKNNWSVDHITPLSKDGPEVDEENLVGCCAKCNSTKGDKPLIIFIAKFITKNKNPLKARQNYYLQQFTKRL